MRYYGIINGTHDLVNSSTLYVWEFERYEEDGSVKPYLGFECVSENLIPSNGTIISNFRDWLNQYAPTEI